ncbi:PTS transporter subunit EIIC [[Eubacterium] hominis]|uniref:PTS transporter subunit EIIC n=1 Tax=[Eubacterium] hominis TaxID=2764325 RepID=UPI003A4D948E
MKEKFIGAMQSFSKAIVAPVLYLPAVGLILVICNFMINPNIVSSIPFLGNDVIQITFKVMYNGLMSVFNNLGPIFAIGVAFGLAKKKKEHAALVAFLCLFIFCAAQNSFLTITETLHESTGNGQNMMLGFQIVDMGVFLGILIGIIVGSLHNKYCDKDLGEVLSVYGGTRFVFLISIPIMLIMAIAFAYLWPPVQSMITNVATFISTSGGIGFFTFGFLERLLIPTGLHHLIGSALWYTDLGGVATIAGETYSGAWAIALAELGDPNTARLSLTTIFNNVTLVKVFGLSGAGLAMLYCAKPKLKNKARAIYVPAILTSCLAAITEPLEFTFLFVSPILFVIHSVLTGIFFYLLYFFQITVCSAGGIFETLLYNVPAGVAKTGWPWFILLGLVQMAVYFFVFKWFILKYDVKIPGRDESEDVKLVTKKDYEASKNSTDQTSDKSLSNSLGKQIYEAVGGIQNIKNIDNCFTRLRIVVDSLELVNENLLKETGSKGLVKRGNEIQIIYGVNVNKFRKSLEDYLEANQYILGGE